MNSLNCDFSPLKQQIKFDLEQIANEIQQTLASFDHADTCLLGTFEKIHERFTHIELTAATFYLQCYLAPYTDHYNDLSLCIQHLSEHRHGALIIVQRKDSLEGLIHPGTPIGANLSFSLLESIFYPGSPLHDGAVLIQGNRIISAGNVLPLSHIQADEKLGTRHRAAIGLSEQSDALVLVVSEETGKTSFALGGKLHPITPGGVVPFAQGFRPPFPSMQ